MAVSRLQILANSWLKTSVSHQIHLYIRFLTTCQLASLRVRAPRSRERDRETEADRERERERLRQKEKEREVLRTPIPGYISFMYT